MPVSWGQATWLLLIQLGFDPILVAADRVAVGDFCPPIGHGVVRVFLPRIVRRRLRRWKLMPVRVSTRWSTRKNDLILPLGYELNSRTVQVDPLLKLSHRRRKNQCP